MLYVTSRSAPCARSGDVAIALKIAPNTGPAQGVQISPSVVPSTKPPRLVRAIVLGCSAAPAPARPAVSRSNAAGQIISAPKITSRTRPAVRNTSGSKCRAVATAFNASATNANDATKPAAMKAGRVPARCPIDAPSKIGSTGSVQGAAIVRMPANNASGRSGIGVKGVRRARRGTSEPAGDGLVLLHIVLFHAVLRHRILGNRVFGHRILRHAVLLHRILGHRVFRRCVLLHRVVREGCGRQHKSERQGRC